MLGRWNFLLGPGLFLGAFWLVSGKCIIFIGLPRPSKQHISTKQRKVSTPGATRCSCISACFGSRRKLTPELLGKMWLPGHGLRISWVVCFVLEISSEITVSWLHLGWNKFILNQPIHNLALASRSVVTFQTLLFLAWFFSWLTASFSSIHKTWSLPLRATS